MPDIPLPRHLHHAKRYLQGDPRYKRRLHTLKHGYPVMIESVQKNDGVVLAAGYYLPSTDSKAISMVWYLREINDTDYKLCAVSTGKEHAFDIIDAALYKTGTSTVVETAIANSQNRRQEHTHGKEESRQQKEID